MPSTQPGSAISQHGAADCKRRQCGATAAMVACASAFNDVMRLFLLGYGVTLGNKNTSASL